MIGGCVNCYARQGTNIRTVIGDLWEPFDVTEDDKRCYMHLEKAFSDAVGADSFMERYQKANVCLGDVLSLKKQVKKRILKYISSLSGK